MLSVKKISCQRGYCTLFSQLSFEVVAGQLLRIAGTNGSGKTSLLKIIAGLNDSESGTISFKNDCVKSDEYQAQVLYLGHLSALRSELSAYENLAFLTQLNAPITRENNPITRENLTAALAEMGLKDYENERCAQLSAGQKRRVILATLIFSNAPIWLLDEPFTALDPLGVKTVEACIQTHCNRGGICLFTTHQTTRLSAHKTLTLG